MFKQKQQKTNIREILPEIVYLETEDFAQAKNLSEIFPNEEQKWQIYINSLAYFGFTKWIKTRLGDLSINHEDCSLFNLKEYPEPIEMIYNLRVGDFKICLIPVESLTESGITIPISILKSAKFAAHFYVLIEVLEEEAQIIIHGLIRHDQIVKNTPLINLNPSLQLPLSSFDHEPNNLLAYLRYLSPKAIALPTENIINLRDWLLGEFVVGWEAIAHILNYQQHYPAFRFRKPANTPTKPEDQRIERVKTLQFEKSGEEIGLVMGISSDCHIEKDTEIKIWTELYPINQTYLPSGLKVIILDDQETVIMDEKTQADDKKLILDFTGLPGENFSVKLVAGEISITQGFSI
jgi:Protein of unknown function (DUF1822)